MTNESKIFNINTGHYRPLCFSLCDIFDPGKSSNFQQRQFFHESDYSGIASNTWGNVLKDVVSNTVLGLLSGSIKTIINYFVTVMLVFRLRFRQYHSRPVHRSETRRAPFCVNLQNPTDVEHLCYFNVVDCCYLLTSKYRNNESMTRGKITLNHRP